jgi:glycosyltransferase involved in cell wall biosynthesis
MGKVLLLSSTPDIPEAHLAVGLHKRGFDLLWMGGGLDTRYGEPINNSSIKTVGLSLSSRCDPRALRTIRAAVKEHDIRIIHAFSSRAISNAVIATIGLNIPIIAYRGTMAHVSKWDPSNWLTYFNPRVKKIICVCDAVRNSLIKDGINPERAVRIYKGHHPSWYASTKANLSSWGIPADALTVSCIARKSVTPAVTTLVMALSQLPSSLSAHAVVIGPISPAECLPPDITPEVAARIHFLGEQPNAATIVGASSVSFIPSSHREGLPKKAIEAMIQGIPVIATAAGGLSEIIVDGSSGLIIPPSDTAALCAALQRVLSDQQFAATLRDGGQRRIEEAFSIEQTISQTAALYSQLLRE